MRRGGVLVSGSSNTDLVCVTDRLPRPGETVASVSFAIYPGGKAANQAVAAARAGADVVFVGAFGDDDYGAARRSELAAEGIELDFAETVVGAPSGLALIAVDRGGQNQIITVAGANDRIRLACLDAAIGARAPAVLLFPNESPPAVVQRLATHPASAIKIMNAAPYGEHLRGLTEHIDFLVCNEIEAAEFVGRDVTPDNAAVAARELAGLAGAGAVITLGEHGAIGCRAAEVVSIPAPTSDVVDTTGAGDAFCGAFAAWLASGYSFDAAMRAGVVAGSLAVTVAGAQPSLPTRARIVDRLGTAS